MVWKLVLEYDGTDFAGWQLQPGVRTVQGELERALSTVLRAPIRVHGAGRTDSGVHALGQVVSFETDADVAAALAKVNGVLPDDVVVRSAEPAYERFHARFDAVRRHYRYRIHRGPSAVERRTSLWLLRALDLEAMREAAHLVPGSRDFASFGSPPEEGGTTECRLDRLEIVEDGRIVSVEASANRFLRRMVRTLVGTLLEVGAGKHPPRWIEEVIEARDRRAAGEVVPARGLFLVSVDYPNGSANGGRT
ncbi:MAG: tRNA pseudouridine(38-40) synthase TruA [bacterium]